MGIYSLGLFCIAQNCVRYESCMLVPSFAPSLYNISGLTFLHINVFVINSTKFQAHAFTKSVEGLCGYVHLSIHSYIPTK